MSKGWEYYEPSPIEFFHEELNKEFHKWRESRTSQITVEINGSELNQIIAKAKKTTYEKYKALALDKPILKSDVQR